MTELKPEKLCDSLRIESEGSGVVWMWGRDRVLMKMMMKYFRPDFLACQCSISASGNMSSIHELPWSGCWQLDITHTQFHTDGHTAVRHNNKHHWDSPRDRDENRTPSFPAPSLIKAVSSGKENPYWVTVNHFLNLHSWRNIPH